jgi:hypothetical protein
MEDLKIVWDGGNAKVGRVTIGNVSYNGIRARENPNEYVAYCYLPQIKPRLGEFITKDEAVNIVETSWRVWIKMLNK